MALIYLIRHGRAAASFTDDLDPGLDELGKTQALGASKVLQRKLPLHLTSSPLLRARETAAPLAEASSLGLTIEPRMAEIPSPGLSLQQRGPWLSNVMAGYWTEQSDALQQWREALATCLLEIQTDTAIFSHFVAINAAVSIAENSDKVLMFRPDNCSITILETDGSTLKLIQRGDEASTTVN